ncbi:ParM/StbA family protein [Clostridium perfringens]|uniref:ParM/StbA family protein n=1 Tax=Clostridium perfringens TaxID=1502 RepID=UPI0022469878|nr:ParM/StbA family protein [Clostridium perfringens]MCX0403353.1 ParM/StbA family protein [Clostridium perfringens]
MKMNLLGTDCIKLQKLMENSTDRYLKLGLTEKDLIVPLNIGINVGNYWTKNRGDNGKSMYRSACSQIDASKVLNIREQMNEGNQPRVIEVDGKLFRIGTEEAITGDLSIKPVEEFRALMLMAIAKQMHKKAKFKKVKLVEVSVCLGLSIKEYSKEGYKKKLANIITGTHHIKYQGLEFIISVQKKNVYVTAEGYAHYEANYSDFVGNDDKGLYLLDIGSQTLDSVHILDGAIHDSDSQPHGVLRLIEDIQDRMKNQTDFADISLIEKMVREGQVEIDKEFSMSEFLDLKANYEERVRLYINNKYKKIPIANKIVAFGGGANVIDDFLKKSYRNLEIPEKAEFLNAEAYYILSFK